MPTMPGMFSVDERSTAFLTAAVHQRPYLHAFPVIQCTDPFRCMELVARHGEHVDMALTTLVRTFVIDWTASVWKTAPLSWAISAIALMGSIVRNLVIGRHDGNDQCLSGHGFLVLLQIDEPELVHRQVGNLETLALQELAGVKNRMMLDPSGYDRLPLLRLA